MSKIILTTQSELESLINLSVRKAISEQADQNLNQEQDKIFSIQEASLFLNLAKQTLYGFTSKNEIPFLKRGKKLYFRKWDLEKWLSEGKHESKKEILEGLANKAKNKKAHK
jgi:excisionase family DNA binding protein